VSLDWNNLGSAPSPQEIEVTVMGPGFGESIVVHIGDNEWIIVDSCRERNEKVPAPSKYLKSIGVDAAIAVKVVVATHWDQDHITGMTDVINACKTANFLCAKAFHGTEFQGFLEERAFGTYDRGVKDIRGAFEALRKTGRGVVGAYPGRIVLKRRVGEQGANFNFEMLSLSPSDKEFDLFLQELASEIPAKFSPLKSAVARTPNLSSVVLGLKWGDASALLGADMETRAETDRGWNAVIDQCNTVLFSGADLVKLPHHGSETGHHNGMWDRIMKPSPVGVIAPYGKGKGELRPPKRSDLARIKSKTSRLFVTAPHGNTKLSGRNPAVIRGFRESNIQTTSLYRAMGIVRFRKLPASIWSVEMFGPAYEVKSGT
jgi:beta-lactamase superfamily II metal-dependent hydrolase